MKRLLSIIVALAFAAQAHGAFAVKAGSTSVLVPYFKFIDTTTGTAKTDITGTDIDLSYIRAQADHSAKVDAVAHAAIDDPWDDDEVFEIDDVLHPGLWRIDWPDAAFADGADWVILTATVSGAYSVSMLVRLVDYDPQDSVALGLAAFDNLASVGAAVNTPPRLANDGFVITHGENEANDEDSTHALDGAYHDLEAVNDGGTEKIDCYYVFTIGGDGVPTGVTHTGYMTTGGGAPKNLYVQAYNWGTTTWNQVGAINSGTTNVASSFALFTSHVGTGVNIGLVHIRFLTGSVALTATSLIKTDQIYVSYAVVNRTVGYALGAVWVDTVNGATGTTSYIHGTADNPTKTWAEALTIAGNMGLERFEIVNGSAIALTANSDNYTFGGHEWTLDLSGESIANAHISEAIVTGISIGTGAHFHDCTIGTSTFAGGKFVRCGIAGGATVTLSGATTYRFVDCYTQGPSPAPIFDFGAAVANTTTMFSNWSGGLQIVNHGANGTDKSSFHGRGSVTIAATSTAGTLGFHGFWTITDNVVGGFVVGGGVINEEARYADDMIDQYVWTDPATRALTELDEDNTTIDLDGSTIGTVTTLTGHTGQTGDTFALANGATGFVAIDTVVDAILVDTDTTIPARLTGIEGAGFLTATDSLEAIRNRGDAAWTTGAGGDATAANQVTILANLAVVDGIVDAILVDTNELQTNQGNWLTSVATSTLTTAQVNAQVTAALTTYTAAKVADVRVTIIKP